jgi:hypothetical protein
VNLHEFLKAGDWLSHAHCRKWRAQNDTDAEGRNSDAKKVCKSGVQELGGGAWVPTDAVAKACDGWLM